VHPLFYCGMGPWFLSIHREVHCCIDGTVWDLRFGIQGLDVMVGFFVASLGHEGWGV
jgi:hypothetical protein